MARLTIGSAMIDQIRAVFHQPGVVAGTWKAARAHGPEITGTDARVALQRRGPLRELSSASIAKQSATNRSFSSSVKGPFAIAPGHGHEV
jgi:hypothetical protein